ncbi:Hint domain-containing protein [Yoonia sp.]|uniref:Hint domain-containing protein n=1 Tax=Yoonia sp. TaxID=2212373 RepID=UPI0019D913C9|nr:Hint domain-containing protein [Yoonia sp.]MBE0413310.1 Hint domain-containing protein [Yoonia sp.]
MSDTFWARINQDNAGNNAINLEKDIAPIEITFVAKDPDGDTFLDPVPGQDPNTQVKINNVLYDFEYIVYGIMPNDSKVPVALQGEPVVIIQVIDYPISGTTERLIFLPESDATQQEMAGIQQGNISPIQDGTLPNVPVCFVSGTMIETPCGPVMVDDLRQGDLVMTVDDGPQPLVWVTSSTHTWPGSDEKFKPVQIKAGAFGDGLPVCDLMVSPQHHFLMRSPDCQALFGQPEVIAPAKGLTGLTGVRHMQGKKTVTYHHMLLAQHALLLAGGVQSESFYPGLTAISMLNNAQRDALFALFPALRENPETGYGQPVRHKVTRRQAENIVRSMQQRAVSAERAA